LRNFQVEQQGATRDNQENLWAVYTIGCLFGEHEWFHCMVHAMGYGRAVIQDKAALRIFSHARPIIALAIHM